jgi:hypothetical protein
LVSVVGVMVAACSSEEIASDDQDIAIDKATEDPAKILPGDFDTRLLAVMPPQDTGKAFGLGDDEIPYPDTYWPFRLVDDNTGKTIAKNGIDDRWQGESVPSPLEKYMSLLDPARSAEARDWESKNHGEKLPGVANWFGHCPGWTASAMVNPPLRRGISVRRAASGQLTECSPGEQGCVKFEIGDLNALEAEVFEDAKTSFLGARCDTKLADIPRDEHGRVLKSGCRGLNPGALVVVLANRMKNVRNVPGFVPQAIAIDAQTEKNTDEIWNQPAYRYVVNEARPISEADAIRMTTKPGSSTVTTRYPWNKDARGFARVNVDIKWVQENGPNKVFVSGSRSTKTMRIVAVLELDGDPQSPSTRIIGGEFLEEPVTGATRLTVPPFVWTAEGLMPDSFQGRHNPFVRGSVVQGLVKLATGT